MVSLSSGNHVINDNIVQPSYSASGAPLHLTLEESEVLGGSLSSWSHIGNGRTDPNLICLNLKPRHLTLPEVSWIILFSHSSQLYFPEGESQAKVILHMLNTRVRLRLLVFVMPKHRLLSLLTSVMPRPSVLALTVWRERSLGTTWGCATTAHSQTLPRPTGSETLGQSSRLLCLSRFSCCLRCLLVSKQHRREISICQLIS